MRVTRTLLLVVGATIGLNVVATAVAIDHGWPAAFGTRHDPSRVSHDWIASGTAISAPLVPLIALAILTALATRPRRLGALGAALCALIGVVFVVATLGEPTTLDPDSSLEELFHLLAVAFSATLIFAAAKLTRTRLRSHD